MFGALEAKLEAIWHAVDGDTRAGVESAVADLKAEVATLKLAPVVTKFEADVKAVIAEVVPGAEAAVEGLGEKVLADVVAAVGQGM